MFDFEKAFHPIFMGLPKKAPRKITIDGVRYAWIASGNDGGIDLTVKEAEGKGQRLTVQFEYYTNCLKKGASGDSLSL